MDAATVNTLELNNRHERCPHLPSASPSQQKGGDGATVASLWTPRRELFPTGCRKRLSCPYWKTHCSAHIRKLGYPRTTLTPLLLPIFSEWKRQASVMLHPPPTPPPNPVYKKGSCGFHKAALNVEVGGLGDGGRQESSSLYPL